MDFCRLCFLDTPLNFCTNLFDNQPQNELQIIDMIATLTDIRVHEDDAYPKIICYNCHEKLINFYYFRQVVLQTHMKFRLIFDDQNNNVFINNVEQDNSGQIKIEKFENENMEIHKQIQVNNEIDRFPSVFIKEETEDKTFTNEELSHENSDSITTNENCHTPQEDTNTSNETESMINNVVKDQNKIDENEEKHAIIKEEIVEIEEHFPVLNDEDPKMNGDPIVINTSTVRKKRRQSKHKYDKNFKCTNCGNLFLNELLLKMHVLNNRRKAYKCKLCCKGFDDIVAYKIHTEKQHSLHNETYPCQFCDRVFKTSSAQHIHISFKHNKNNNNDNNNKKFQCTVCDKRFTSVRRLNTHLIEHNSPEPFQCNQCTQKFSSPTLLKRHLIDEHSNMERPYRCDMCYKKFVLLGSFRNHLNSHDYFKPYKCDFCSKRFTYENNLNIHSRLHTGENLIKCKKCDRKFTYKSHLNSHLPVHDSDLN